MLNLVGGNCKISTDKWALSLVSNPKTDHSFLVLEGTDAEDNRLMFEAHLGHKKLSDTEYDDTKCGIYFMETSIQKLQKISKDFLYKTWEVTKEDVLNIKNKIVEDQVKANSKEGIDYVKFSNTEGGFQGIIGDTLDWFNLNDSKDNMIEAVHDSMQGNASKQVSHDMSIAFLNNARERENCTSWAIKTVKSVKNYDEGVWAKFILIVPEIVFSEETACRNSGCQIF
jgi:hypothetical protein